MGIVGQMPNQAKIALSKAQGRAPLATDDSLSSNYVGTLWTNAVTREIYICLNDAPGAAVWEPLTEKNPQPPGGGILTWTPPGFPNYSGYEQRTLSNTSFNHSVPVGSNRDAVFTWAEPITDSGGQGRRIIISGWRNVVVIGGERINSDTGTGGSLDPNRACLQIDRCNGIVHLEGIWLHGNGVADCLVTTSGPEAGGYPGCTLRVQNCRFEPKSLHGIHGDGIQIWGDPGGGWNGGFKQLDVDRLTILSSYQALLLGTHDGCMQGADVRNANFKGVAATPGCTQSGMGWIFFKSRYPDVGGFYSTITLTNCWAENSIRLWNSYPNMCTPNAAGDDAIGSTPLQPFRAAAQASDSTGQYVHWPDPASDVKGKLYIGDPPGGDFCPLGVAGMNYVSPGYQ